MTAPVVFMFSGQGSQYHHMGRGLYETEPVFRDTLRRLDALVAPAAGGSVVERLYDPGRTAAEPFVETAVTHPAIVMVELALAETLMSYGVIPDLLLGVSLGEYTASVLAGVMEAGECLTRLVDMARSAGDCDPGGMLAVLAGTELYDREPALHQDLDLAARNYRAHFVVSGPLDALARAETVLTERQVPYQRVPVAHGFHSRLMDPSRPAFDALWQGVELRPPSIPLFSSASAGPLRQVTSEHLWRVARAPIEFSATVAALEARGPHRYVDAGPAGTLHNFVRAHLADAGTPGSSSQSTALLTPFAQDAARVLRRVVDELRSYERPATPAYNGTTVDDSTSNNRRSKESQVSQVRVYGFPGQGSQAKGMGADLFDAFPEEVAEADAILGYSVRELCLSNPDGRLRRTEFTQPALYVVEALSYLRRRQEDPTPPDFLVGHSLGEYTALFAAGAFDFGTGLRLVGRRGELMGRATGGGMAAVLGMDVDAVERLLAEAGLAGLDIANHNTPEQVVLAGPTADLDRARPVFEDRGARVVALNVSAPFHSRYMRAAADEFRRLLDATEFRPPWIPVIANLDARPYRPEHLRQNLTEQITGRVRWVDTIRTLMGVDRGDFTFEELGPGKALTKMVAKTRELATPLPAPTAAPQPPLVESEELPAADTVAAVSAAPTPMAHPLLDAEDLGAPSFRDRYGLRLAYLGGGMYGGISSPQLVVRLAKAGCMGFFGTGGLSPAEVEDGLREIRNTLGPAGAFGANLLHRHAHPEQEQALVDLLLRLRVSTVEASGFLRITPALVKYRLKGGRIIAKVTRTDMAEAFLRPAPDDVVRALAGSGEVTAAEAARAPSLAMADDLCVEGDAGWCTAGSGPATLLPAVLRLRDELAGTWPRVHVGVAGGIGSPEAAAASFVLGAEFLVTGSVNQCTVEAGTSPEVKDMLQRVEIHDTEPAPWSEMFELGERARVVKRGVFLAARADRLYQLWRLHDSFADIGAETRRQVEETCLRRPFEEAWREALARHGAIPVADGDVPEKRRMALAFRSYLDRGFDLARTGSPGRKVDYLVYCGPAMGAFNHWVRGTGLEPWQARNVDVVADRLLTEAARLLRERGQLFRSAA
ncbi:ACP S-malonyltransferase [Streptomyces sp. ADMS]|uniref:ACP S-malonyltransferase n=1 Tax=Streptomyces sp. ADMS TaxID=3071415 RepID=UPI00296E6CA7|nr:ACP S-malonyltransferase [Streptomyces sp. ADMS]MDW4905774.1 ACP S-malonyltransferase [Streptomyces sp. ADMS]